MKQIKELVVKFISLVTSPANRRPVVFKSDDDRVRVEGLRIVKRDIEKGIVYGVVYEPDRVDTQGDWTTADVIEKACYTFAEEKLFDNVDFQHDERGGRGTIVENFIKKGTHPDFEGVNDGAWCVAIKLGEEMKSKAAEIGGLSLQGFAVYKDERAAPNATPHVNFENVPLVQFG